MEGELGFPEADGAFDSMGYMWECPFLVRLPDEETGEERDVLVFCPQGIRTDAEGYENIYPCAYTVGRLVGNDLLDCDGTIHEVDRGFEFYAPQVFARRPSAPGPALLMGWTGNAEQDDQPSIDAGGWVHAMTVPRELTLRGGRLLQQPVGLHDGEPRSVGADDVDAVELAGHRSWRLELEAGNQDPDAPVRWSLRIGSQTCRVDVEATFSPTGGRLVVDPSTSRYTAHGTERIVSLPAGVRPRLEVLHDRSVTELFVGDGEVAFTLRSFLESEASGVVSREAKAPSRTAFGHGRSTRTKPSSSLAVVRYMTVL